MSGRPSRRRSRRSRGVVARALDHHGQHGGDRADDLDAGRAAADDGEAERPLAFPRIGQARGLAELALDAPLQL